MLDNDVIDLESPFRRNMIRKQNQGGKRKEALFSAQPSAAAPYRRNHLDAKTCRGFLHTNYSSASQEISMTEGVYGGCYESIRGAYRQVYGRHIRTKAINKCHPCRLCLLWRPFRCLILRLSAVLLGFCGLVSANLGACCLSGDLI